MELDHVGFETKYELVQYGFYGW